MKEYKVYIDLGDENGYFEVFPVSVSSFKKSLEADEFFRRYKWGNVVFRNLPDKYKKEAAKAEEDQDPLLLKAYSIYDEIKGSSRINEIHIKFEYGSHLIEGYFGDIDGSYKDDPSTKTITIDPIVLDQYTDFLENYETQMDIIGARGSNKLVNGDFQSWYNKSSPVGWGFDVYAGVPDMNKVYVLDSWMLGLDASDVNHGVNQTIQVIEGNSIDLSFDYNLLMKRRLISGSDFDYRIDTNFEAKRIYVTINNNYQLNANGSWSAIANGLEYNGNVLPLYLDELKSMKHFRVRSNSIPESGELKLVFDDRGFSQEINYIISDIESVFEFYTQLLIDNVKLITSNTQYTTIRVPIYNDYLETYSLFSYNKPPWIRASPKTSDLNPSVNDIDEFYFDSDGVFKEAFMNDGEGRAAPQVYGAVGSIGYGFFLNDILALFETENNDWWKCQLSRIIIYRCDKTKIRGKKRHRVYAEISFSRDEAYSPDVDGVITYPPGTGWVDSGKADPVKGRLFWRKPFNDENDEIPWIIHDLEYPGGTFSGYPIRAKVTSERNYAISENSRVFTRAIELREVIQTLFRNVHPLYADRFVYSTFFWNDNEENISTLAAENSGANYVDFTINPNPLNNIACLHTSEFKQTPTDPDSDEAELKVSFKGFMDDFKLLFIKHGHGNLYWYIDENRDLHIEHVRYREMKGFTGQVIPENLFYRNYTYDKKRMYSRITIDQINSGYPDFSKNEILFDKISSGKRGKEILLESVTKYITTDLNYCIQNPNDLENSFCFINYELDGAGEKKVISAPVQISDKVMLNGELALSVLLKKYCLQEGTFNIGELNGETVQFKSTFRTKKGQEFTTKKIIEDGVEVLKGIIDGDYLSTSLGIGLVEDIEHDFDNQLTRVNLIYGARPAVLAQSETDFEGAANIMLNIGFF